MNEIINAISYSWNSMTWITWLVLILLGAKTVQSFNKAYKENKNYQEMKNNKDKSGLAHFYNGIVVSILCIIVFFLPYIINNQG
jgi:surface polysaccharide O-acyltransferase-like enzyme